jgi:hypothetical protein
MPLGEEPGGGIEVGGLESTDRDRVLGERHGGES